HGSEQFALCNIFEYIASSACLKGVKKVIRFFMYSDKNHTGSGRCLFDTATRSQAIQFRHAYIEEGEIRLQTAAKLQSFKTISCLSYHFQSSMAGEQSSQTGSGKIMVVSDHQLCRSRFASEGWI